MYRPLFVEVPIPPRLVRVPASPGLFGTISRLIVLFKDTYRERAMVAKGNT